MASITCFDDLPDLVLFELFSYLSSVDILWGFTHLNHRLTMLIIERGFLYHIELSLAHYDQFNTILGFLPLNNIQSLFIDSNASPFQLTHWPYLPRLQTFSIIGVYNYNDLLLFLLLHAATITNLIIKSNETLIPEGHSIELEYPMGSLMLLFKNILLIHLPVLRTLDLCCSYDAVKWPIPLHIPVSLTYLRLSLDSMNDLVRLISTQPLSNTLHQLHVTISNNGYRKDAIWLITNSPISLVNLQKFTFYQEFFSRLRIEWIFFEILTSSKIMPVLRHTNLSIFININDLYNINSSSLFTDHRRVDVHFAFHLIDCPQYIEVTPYIPRGNRFHPREIVGATFVVNDWCDLSYYERLYTYADLNRGRRYGHHMWYTLPWKFDEFFYQGVPRRWITNIRVFEPVSQNRMAISQSSLRTLNALGPNLASSLFTLPYVVLSNYIETLHLSYYNGPIRMNLFALRHITLINSIGCLTYSSSFPTTIRSIRILLFYRKPEYTLPDWSAVLYSVSTLSQLISLRIFIYDVPRTVDNKYFHIIAEIASVVIDFGFCFRSVCGPNRNSRETVFKNHTKFIKQLCHCILSLSHDKIPYYSIESDGCGLTTWF